VPWRPERPAVAPGPPPRSFRRTSSRQAPPKLPLAATNTTTTTFNDPPILPPRTSPASTNSIPELPHKMAEKELSTVLAQLNKSLQSHNYEQSTSLLSKAKIALLNLNALIPQEKSSRKHLQLARDTLELGAIISIRLKDTVSFTRYFQQLQPFYSLPEKTLPKDGGNSSKVTGLYLLLLLSEGDYAGFHTLLETLEVAAAQDGKKLEDDQFIQYPIRLEQALMEGSYDRVWGETKKERVPSEEFGLFTEVRCARDMLMSSFYTAVMSTQSTTLTHNRSSSVPSARKSLPAASAHTPPSPYLTPSRSSSSTQKAAL
jgi:hypothetical protein